MEAICGRRLGVRDCLLGREPKDWDFTPSARPEQVKGRVFAHPHLIQDFVHGTVKQ